FGDDAEFLKAIQSGMKSVMDRSSRVDRPKLTSSDSAQNWPPIEKIAATAREADGLKSVVLEMEVESSAPFELSVYYTNGNPSNFLPRQHVDVAVKKGRNVVDVKIPVGVLAKLRIDFGIEPGLLRVSRVTLRGNGTVVLDWRKFAFHDVEARMVSDDGSVTLFSKGNDPYAVYPEVLNLQAPVS
ncbi:MAG: hypothetical protein KBT68_10015, partial [bacterium]|nr:hypothetical protein [Candidatus Colisoma equi]